MVDIRDSKDYVWTEEDIERERMIPIINKWCEKNNISEFDAIRYELRFVFKYNREMKEEDYLKELEEDLR